MGKDWGLISWKMEFLAMGGWWGSGRATLCLSSSGLCPLAVTLKNPGMQEQARWRRVQLGPGLPGAQTELGRLLPFPNLKGLCFLVTRNIRIKTLLQANLSLSSGAFLSPSWLDCPQVQLSCFPGPPTGSKDQGVCRLQQISEECAVCLHSISHSLTKNQWPDSLVAKRWGVTDSPKLWSTQPLEAAPRWDLRQGWQYFFSFCFSKSPVFGQFWTSKSPVLGQSWTSIGNNFEPRLRWWTDSTWSEGVCQPSPSMGQEKPIRSPPMPNQSPTCLSSGLWALPAPEIWVKPDQPYQTAMVFPLKEPQEDAAQMQI